MAGAQHRVVTPAVFATSWMVRVDQATSSALLFQRTLFPLFDLKSWLHGLLAVSLHLSLLSSPNSCFLSGFVVGIKNNMCVKSLRKQFGMYESE